MPLTRELLLRAAPRVTRHLAIRWGESFPFYYVLEYAKSGGTWVSKMLADYLQLPYPQYSLLPVAMPAVIHNHWGHHPGLRRVVYVIRDGRDIMVSLFFHRMLIIRRGATLSGSPMAARRFARIYDDLFGKGYEPADTGRLLPLFIEEEFRHPRQCRETWPEHVGAWLAREDQRVAYVRYEDLLADADRTLTNALQVISDDPIDGQRLRSVVKRHTFEATTGRERGTESRTSFVRKGIAGDWRNHFTREAARVFDALAGDTLVQLGYERDRSWVDTCNHELESYRR